MEKRESTKIDGEAQPRHIARSLTLDMTFCSYAVSPTISVPAFGILRSAKKERTLEE